MRKGANTIALGSTGTGSHPMLASDSPGSQGSDPVNGSMIRSPHCQLLYKEANISVSKDEDVDYITPDTKKKFCSPLEGSIM